MKITRIDKLGRIVIPVNYRKALKLTTETDLSLECKENAITITSHQNVCRICENKIKINTPFPICVECIDKIKKASIWVPFSVDYS